jgi:hypothetical protein
MCSSRLKNRYFSKRKGELAVGIVLEKASSFGQRENLKTQVRFLG